MIPPKSSPELPIQQKAYQAVLEMVQTVERMPRSHRFTLGDRIIVLSYDLLTLTTHHMFLFLSWMPQLPQLNDYMRP